MSCCCVPGCKKYSRQKFGDGHKLSYFQLPNDETRRQEWITRLNLDKDYFRINRKVCQDHFHSSMFLSASKVRLKSNAVPNSTVSITPTAFDKEKKKKAKKNEEVEPFISNEEYFGDLIKYDPKVPEEIPTSSSRMISNDELESLRKSIEKEVEERIKQSSDLTIAALEMQHKSEITKLQSELIQVQQNHDSGLIYLQQKHESELLSLQQSYSPELISLRQRLQLSEEERKKLQKQLEESKTLALEKINKAFGENVRMAELVKAKLIPDYEIKKIEIDTKEVTQANKKLFKISNSTSLVKLTPKKLMRLKTLIATRNCS